MGLYSLAALKPFKVKALFRLVGFTLFAIPALFFNGLPAFAHHPLAGKTPSSFIEGFLSGIGHPVIELGHLIFAIATAAYWVGRRLFKQASEAPSLALRFAGFAICGVGGTFVSTFLMESIFLA